MMAAMIFIAAISCTKQTDYTQLVDTHIGTGGHGHVFVGASVPFGFVQLGPTSIPQSWDWCSGYHVSDSTVIGFSHTHLSGTGIGDLFDVTVMPVVGDVTYARGTEEDPSSGLWSYADRSREVSTPSYYSVPLTRYGITAEMTATCRTGMHRYTFPKSEEAAVVIDLMNGGCWDAAVNTGFKVVDADEDGCGTAVQGWRWSKGWADNQKIYFYAEFSKPFKSFELIEKTFQKRDGGTVSFDMFGRAAFETSEGEQIMLKVGLSPVSEENAKANLMAENPDWDFEAVVKDGKRLWNKELSKIRIETQDEQARTVFYTALYHTMIAPSVYHDVNGDYRGSDDQVRNDKSFTNHTTFSLWDTYRAAMPLYSIFQSERFGHFINTMLHIHQQQGKLPVWHLMGCETNCMVGNPGIPPVADAILKGFDGFDKELAFKAMKESAMRPDRGQEFRIEHGYIPCDLMYKESVAFDMEYAIADAAIAEAALWMAENTQDKEKAEQYLKDHEYFLERSHSYRNYYDPSTRFIRAKDSKGQFDPLFDPIWAAHRANTYCEGNAWQYTWLAPHDVQGLQDCFGSREAMLEKLDSLFVVSSYLGDEASPDISGLIGQYAHGNEPSHHTLYLYAMVGQPWKTADRVRQTLSELYFADPNGLSGNEDVGQMSAWYIMSSLGFYQSEPAGGRYWLGSPTVDKAQIEVKGGIFTINVLNNSNENKYIQKVSVNGKPLDKGYVTHAEMVAGGQMTIEMGSEPVLWY